MRRLMVLLGVGAVLAMVMVAFTIPAMAQTEQDKKEAKQLVERAEEAGIAIPSDPEERIQLGAQYGITISPEVAAAMDEAMAESTNPKTEKKGKGGKKELPKSGGANVGSLLGLGAAVALMGGGLVAYRSARRGG